MSCRISPYLLWGMQSLIEKAKLTTLLNNWLVVYLFKMNIWPQIKLFVDLLILLTTWERCIFNEKTLILTQKWLLSVSIPSSRCSWKVGKNLQKYQWMTSIFVKLQAEGSMVATVFYKWSFGDVHEKAFLKTLRFLGYWFFCSLILRNTHGKLLLHENNFMEIYVGAFC